VILLTLIRYVDYKPQKYHLFLLDFCYFVQFLAVLNIVVFWNSQLLTNVVFAFSNGPLAFAILAWRNSLVFHDVDKITSTFIHFFPPLLTFAMRWHPICWNQFFEAPGECARVKGPHAYEFSFLWDSIIYPAGFYLLWQMAYLIVCEVLLGKYITNDPDVQTSLKWLSTDPRSSIYKVATGACVKLGVMYKGEILDPARWKTKIIFVVSQLVYTIVVLLPVTLFHRYYVVHACWLCFLYVMLVWNGASFYIEVFSRRYQKVAFPQPTDERPAEDSVATSQDKAGAVSPKSSTNTSEDANADAKKSKSEREKTK